MKRRPPALILAFTMMITASSHAGSLDSEHHIDLPFNQYSALNLLAKWQVSSTELPAYVETNNDNLFGTDNNENSVRDDYEKALLNAYQKPEYVVMGLLSTYVWQRLLQLNVNTNIVTTNKEAIALLVNSMSINHCYYLLQQVDQDLMSPVLVYFNTQQRLDAKKQAEHKLLTLIGNQQNKIEFPSEPCSVFANLIHSEPIQQYIEVNSSI
ncbi:hypothetical protein [Photobacterium sanguinicancri]|uniref:hypothetical protein n=1 Tax=Photobacterium sanguinicancri TaxID=875932 RepID=UPI0007899918|nr:hypothetical protein [Photobacterium sanguinicancri]KXI24307.1 hypothetical protein AS132_02295 [Photobacterium sanguinicancri]